MIKLLVFAWFMGLVFTPLFLTDDFDEPGAVAIATIFWPITWLFLIGIYSKRALQLFAKRWRE
jgi:hypothetical protein